MKVLLNLWTVKCVCVCVVLPNTFHCSHLDRFMLSVSVPENVCGCAGVVKYL